MANYPILFALMITIVRGQNFPSQPLDLTPCSAFPVVKDFDLHRYLGQWYEIERFFNPFQNGSCGTAEYALFNNGSVSVINTQVVEGGKLDTIYGVATSSEDPSVAQLNVRFPSSEYFEQTTGQRSRPNYNVVATDYDNYAVVYTCDFFGPQIKIEFSWILARRPHIPASFSRELKEWLQRVNINAKRYIPTVQTNCPRRSV